MVVDPGCTAAGCYLAGQAGVLSLPLVTIAGLVDGINPCAIGMMVTLLGYILVFGAEKQKGAKILKIGLLYILTVFLTYLTIGLVFYNLAYYLQRTMLAVWFNKVIGAGLLLAALIQIKDFFWPDSPIHLRIPGASKEKLAGLVEKTSVLATVLLAVAVTVLETPCSLPVYVGTATLLAQSGLPMIGVLGYFAYYNFLFILPLIAVLLIVFFGKRVVEMREWEHKAERWMKLALGIVLLGLSVWLLTK